MIRLFKTNHPSVYFSLLVLSLLSRLGAFFNFEEAFISESLFGEALNFLNLQAPGIVFTGLFLSCIMVWAAAIIFNYVLAEKELISRSTYLPAALFIVISSLLPFSANNVAGPLGQFFLVISYYNFVKINTSKSVDDSLFFSSVFLAISSFFLPWVTLLLIANWVIAATILPETPRRIGIMLVAFLLPYYFMWTGFMLADSGYKFALDSVSKFQIDFGFPSVSIAHIVSLSLLGITGIIGMVKVLSSSQYLILKLRLWYRYSFWFAAFAFLAVGLSNNFSTSILLLAIPFSIAINSLLNSEKSSFWQEIIFISFIVVSVLSSFSFYNVFLNETLPNFFY